MNETQRKALYELATAVLAVLGRGADRRPHPRQHLPDSCLGACPGYRRGAAHRPPAHLVEGA
ncbi:hypothetical protein U6Y29_07535 [Cutibacterium acnes]